MRGQCVWDRNGPEDMAISWSFAFNKQPERSVNKEKRKKKIKEKEKKKKQM